MGGGLSATGAVSMGSDYDSDNDSDYDSDYDSDKDSDYNSDSNRSRYYDAFLEDRLWNIRWGPEQRLGSQ